MPRTYAIFGDIEGKLDVLRVECTKCEMHQRLRPLCKTVANIDSDTWRDYAIGGYVQRTPRQACPAVAQASRRDCAVRLRGREATGVVIGNSHYEYRVRVQWDDSGEVTHCLKRNLEPAR
jgi:hypothetical protein